jgi:hypothetical protein
MASLSGIRERVIVNTLRQDAAADEESSVNTWINQYIREDLCAVHNWASMFTRQTVYLTADVALYAWPEPTVWKTALHMGIRSSTSDPFTKLDEISFSQALYGASRVQTGYPKYWCKRGDGFMVIPTPDVSTYQIEVIGFKYPYDLVADADTNDFTTRYARVVEAGATARGWLQYGEDAKAQLWLQLEEKWRRQALMVDKDRMLPFEMFLQPEDVPGDNRLPDGGRYTDRPYSWWSGND